MRPLRTPGTLERADGALLAAYLLAAALGTWNGCLLFNDGAVFLAASWLGNAWDLYLVQFASRAASTLVAFGPAWAARWAFGLSAGAYITLAHALYFAMPLGLWFTVRAVEPHRVFSRLYLATTLTLVYFPTEVLVGTGLWMVWLALVAGPARSARHTIVVTLGFALVLAFTHAATAMMSVLYLTIGGALTWFGRPFPRHTLKAAAAMSVLLVAAYAATSTLLPPTNPTIVDALTIGRNDYIDPSWMLATLALFPMLALLWLLLLAPGVEAVSPRWRLLPPAVATVGVLGLWFAANGTSLFTYLFARHTASHVLVVALALALAGSATEWLMRARQPLMWCAAIAAVAAISYNVDIALYGRFVDRHLAPGIIDVDGQRPTLWPVPRGRDVFDTRVYFKWAAGSDYVRDVILSDYERYRQVLAFYSFFRSDRRSVLFHRIPPDNWIPFECAPVDRALARARDEPDRRFLTFLRENYCVR